MKEYRKTLNKLENIDCIEYRTASNQEKVLFLYNRVKKSAFKNGQKYLIGSIWSYKTIESGIDSDNFVCAMLNNLPSYDIAVFSQKMRLHRRRFFSAKHTIANRINCFSGRYAVFGMNLTIIDTVFFE